MIVQLTKSVSLFVVGCLIIGLTDQVPSEAREPGGAIHGLQELFLVTTFIEMYVVDTRIGTGTGFFCVSDDKQKLFLITNRHIVRNDKELLFPDRLRLRLHVDPGDLTRFENYDVQLYNDRDKTQRRWRELDPSIDVVAIELPVGEIGKFYLKALDPNLFAKSETQLGIGEPVVIIGYPLGFFDDVHTLPVARQGAIASVYPIPFRGNPYFLVDANLHPGTSGSPVISRPTGVRMTEQASVQIGGPTFYFVGVSSGTYGNLSLNVVWFPSVIERLIKAK